MAPRRVEEVVIPHPRARAQLKAALRPDEWDCLLQPPPAVRLDALRPDELDLLRQSHCVVEGVELSPQALEQWRESIGKLLKEKQRLEREGQEQQDRERQDQERFSHLGLSPAEERLYRCLENDQELSDDEAVEIVYQKRWSKLTARKQGQFRTRLKALQHALNSKLQRHSRCWGRVVRPEAGRLVLVCPDGDCDQTPPDDDQDQTPPVNDRQSLEMLQAAVAKTYPSHHPGRREMLAEDSLEGLPRALLKEFLPPGDPRRHQLQAEEAPPSPARRTCEECMAAIRAFLADGPKNAAALRNDCERQGFSPRTIKRARQALGIRAVRDAGQWFAALS